MLTRAEIDDILKLINGSEFAELKLEMGDLKLELRKGHCLAHSSWPKYSRRRLPTSALCTANSRCSPRHRFGWRFRNSCPTSGRLLARPTPWRGPVCQTGRHDHRRYGHWHRYGDDADALGSGRGGWTVLEICAPNLELVDDGQCLIRSQPQ
jgi:acetyl-CoA carboxylase biotin carboxyl carrier protein